MRHAQRSAQPIIQCQENENGTGASRENERVDQVFFCLFTPDLTQGRWKIGNCDSCAKETKY